MKTNWIAKMMALALIAVALTAEVQAMRIGRHHQGRVAPADTAGAAAVAATPGRWDALMRSLYPKDYASLHRAARNGNLRAVQAHIAAGADVNVRTSSGDTPLLLAAVYKHAPVVVALLAAGADINAGDKIGGTALHWAAYIGYPKMVRILIAANARIDIKDSDGHTALDVAHYRGHDQCEQLILGHEPSCCTIFLSSGEGCCGHR